MNMVAFNKHAKYGLVCGENTHGVRFKQSGRLFNHEYQEVDEKGALMNGDRHVAPIEAMKGKAKAAPPAAPTTIPELLAAKDKMAFMAWKKLAGNYLDPVPSLKQDIVAQLEAKIPEGDKPVVETKAAPETDDDEVAQLKAWADKRVAQRRLFGDVQRLMRTKYNKSVHNERDAINFLIDEGVIPAEFARNV